MYIFNYYGIVSESGLTEEPQKTPEVRNTSGAEGVRYNERT